MWKSININTQNIKVKTIKATLIKMPQKGKYNGYSFWHTNKLVRDGNNDYAISISYTNDFIFTLIKYSNSKYNHNKIIDKIEIDVEEFEKEFDCMSDCTREKSNETYLYITEPVKVDKNIEIAEELKNE